jgi:hypothetical protein
MNTLLDALQVVCTIPSVFDFTRPKKNRECRMIKIDHEQILCHNRVKVFAELVSTFRQLVLSTIDKADTVPRKAADPREPEN